MALINLVQDFCATSAQKLIAGVIKQGPVPKHVAIIMDGNRRFARKQGYKTVVDGHRVGANTLTEILDAFAEIGVPEVTVYSFSEENFKRAKEEVNGLMELGTMKAQQWCNDLDTLEKKGIGIEIVGDYTKAPTSLLRHLFAKLMWGTKSNKRFRLNIAFAYAGQKEITKGLTCIINGLKRNEICVDDVNEKLLETTFTIRSSNPVDLLIRPGGDYRMSDFMLWQSSHAYLDFMEDITWPEFNYWHLAKSIFRYQMQVLGKEVMWTSQNKECDKKDNDNVENAKRKSLFLAKKVEHEWRDIMTRAVNAA